MSQYPPNPNYNPYGQNPPDPNFNQGTAYGGPPSGPEQNPNPYNPYPNNPPDTNPSPYGPYGQNPPTPAPPPYNPYGQTVPSTNPNYNQYGTVPPAPTLPSTPPTQPRRGPSIRVILIAVIALVLVLGGIAFGLISNNNTQQSNANANATATAQAKTKATATAHAQQTATAQAALTATAIASNYPFSANLALNDPLVDNSKGVGWENDSFCKFQGSAYHVFDPQSNTYNSCTAANSNYTDFTFQVQGELKSGDGIGLTFRGNNNQLYRFMVFTDGSYNVVLYVDTTGTNARKLTTGSLPSTPDLTSTNTIAVVARGTSFTFYFNQTAVTTYSDPSYSHGQIGLATYDITNSAEAIFTNLKVWTF